MSDIAINPVTRRVQFTGNTGTGPYAFNFNILQSSDIVVYKNNVLLTETTDYTVSIAANGTGNITLTAALVLTDILTIIGGRELSRTTDFVTAGDLLASSLNEQLDSNVIMSQQLDERFGRTIKAQPGDEDATLDLPTVANRANKIILFDTSGNVTAASATDFFTNSVLGGNYIVNTATGDGSQTAFGLTVAPGVATNIQIHIDGVYQNKATFSLSGSTVTFSEAPPLNSSIEFIMGEAVTQITGNASAITYNQGGTGAQDRTVQSKLQDTVSVKDFGAVGDGITDDAAAVQAAVNAAAEVHFVAGESYLLQSQIDVPTTCKRIMINGATLLVDHAGPSYVGSKATFDCSGAIEIHDGIFEAQNKDYTHYYGYTASAGWTSGSSPVGGTETYTFESRDFLFGLKIKAGSIINNNKMTGFYNALEVYKSGGAPAITDPQTRITNNRIISCGGGSSGVTAGFKHTYLANLIVDGNSSYFGGEHTFNSCQNIRITNNRFFNPTTPTIDVGGSSASGYNSEFVVIANNISWGRDPIVCERGAFDVTIADNLCIVTAVHPSGVGIGVTDQSDSNQGLKNISITGNQIRRYKDDGTYTIANGIKVATESGATSTISNIIIANNRIYPECFYAITAQGNSTNDCYDVLIDGNTGRNSTRGILLTNVNRAEVLNNDVNGTSYQGGSTSPFEINACTDVIFRGNAWKGTDASTFGHANCIRINGANSNIKMYAEDISLPNYGYLIYRDGAATGDFFFDIKDSDFGSVSSPTNIVRGSKHTFIDATAGGNLGEICTTGGASPIFKTFGAISS